MKTMKIFSVIFALAASTILGNMFAGFMDAQVMAAGVDILPLSISALLFGAAFIPVSPAGSLCNYVAVSVAKPGQNAGRGGDMDSEIIFFDMDTVNTFPALDAAGVLRSADITFLANAFMIKVYGTPGTIENTSSIEGETDNKGFIQSCKFKHPGSAQEIREFKANWANKNIGIIVKRCGSNSMDLYGEPCNEMQMVTANWKQNKDENSTEFEFKSIGRGNDVSIYTGSIDFGGSGGSSSGV